MRNLASYVGSNANLKLEPENVDDDDIPRKLSTDKSVPWVLALDEDRWPQLPAFDNFSLSQVRDIIRSFLTLVYRKLIFIYPLYLH